MSLQEFEIQEIIEAVKGKPYRIRTRAYYDDADCFADGAIQRIYTETCYFSEDFDFHVVGDTRGNEINWVLHGVKIANAKIWRINKDVISYEYLNVIADGESEDFRQAALVMKYFMFDTEEFDSAAGDVEGWDDIIQASTLFHLDHFEVSKDFRGHGLGHILAKQQLKIAGATGLPVFAWPATNSNYGGQINDPKRLRKFWMNLQEDMYFNEDWNTAYTSEFDPTAKAAQ